MRCFPAMSYISAFSSSDNPRIILATMDTAYSDEFVHKISSGDHLFVVVDELHRLGSPKRRRALRIQAGPRLGLSATPYRYGDPEGTQALFDYFGGLIPPPFTLRDAINSGVLTRYFYHPEKIYLTNSEQEDWNSITKEIQILVARISTGESNTIDINGNPKLKLAKSSRDAVTALAQCLKKIENLKEGIQAVKNKLKEIDGALATLEDKMNRVSTDADMLLAGRKVSMCEQIHDIFESGIAAYRDKLKTDVERDATELFVGISNDPDYIQLKINDNYGLSMVHASGELVPLRSAGFEHVVALSLIGALHKNAPLRGPIIMDSPFGRLDPDHKRNITQALPSMSEQIVLLAYTHEIDEQQTRETLADALKKEYRLTRYSSFHTEIEPQ